jgi:alkylhydroperoxidase/carboxymuconolactone decarboxylase family protein YurZ
MSMLDWNAYRKQLASTIGEIAKAAPDLVKGYRTLVASRATTGALDAKTRELVALAVAVTVRCDGCIADRRVRGGRGVAGAAACSAAFSRG